MSPACCLRGHNPAIGGNQGRLAIDQIGRHAGQPVELTFGPPKFDVGNITALDEPCLVQTLPEGLD